MVEIKIKPRKPIPSALSIYSALEEQENLQNWQKNSKRATIKKRRRHSEKKHINSNNKMSPKENHNREKKQINKVKKLNKKREIVLEKPISKKKKIMQEEYSKGEVKEKRQMNEDKKTMNQKIKIANDRTPKDMIKFTLKDYSKLKKKEKISLLKEKKEIEERQRGRTIKFIPDQYSEDSWMQGNKIFEVLIDPLSSEEFFRDYWEKHELLTSGVPDKIEKIKGLFSSEEIKQILLNNHLEFTKNIDITSYVNGQRKTHNPEGRALPSAVWDFFHSGCSIRMLNPQTYSASIWHLLVTLQEYFKCFCGANVYLTPAGTQGFAPHWDDIEAFVIQIEGKKRWRVYKPSTELHTLPRESSKNFQMIKRKPVLDHVIVPGDVLYFPRGFIHQAEALPDSHSLHITISTYQKNSWVDLLEKVLPIALDSAAKKDLNFRVGLPLASFDTFGIVNASKKCEMKMMIHEQVKNLVSSMITTESIDVAIDQMAKRFIHDSLPPVLSTDEEKCSIFNKCAEWSNMTSQSLPNKRHLSLMSSIRLLRRGCVRLLHEENSLHLYHSLENGREYHADEPKFLEIDPIFEFAICDLIRTYPDYKRVKDLELDDNHNKLLLAVGLWEKGIVRTKKPLKPIGK